MRILLLGNTGQLGYELERSLAALGSIASFDYPAINLGQPESVRTIIQEYRPQVIVNATAYTAVDRAETEPDLAYAVNSRAPAILAEEAKKQSIALIHYSTDYVFDGLKGAPNKETDPTNPLSVYGKSKLEGEQAIRSIGGSFLILRTAWVYSLRRDSFVTKVLQWGRQQRTLRLVTDQVSNPTWCRTLAEATSLALACGRGDPVSWLAERAGLYHLAGDGYASRLEWSRQILANDPNKDQQIVEEIQSALTADFPTAAPRPLFSALDCSLFYDTFGLRMPDWGTILQLAMQV